MLLAGDIGGTKTNLAIYPQDGDSRTPLEEGSFRSGEYDNLESLITEFLDRVDHKVEAVYLGVAGPVIRGKVHATNLPWVIEESRLSRSLKISAVRLLNDLEAVAYSLDLLGASDLHTLNRGEPTPGGAKAIIAPGTGLGEAFLTWNGARYNPHPSEGGHTDFSPNTLREGRLLEYLQERMDHVSCEKVCSGRGIPNIYRFLRDTEAVGESAWVSEIVSGADDPTPVIIDHAVTPGKICPLCRATLEIFISILGAEAGNLALTVIAAGGVFLGGGIPPRILPALEEGLFMDAFLRKGRLDYFMRQIPVHVILNPKAALMGAARYGLMTAGGKGI